MGSTQLSRELIHCKPDCLIRKNGVGGRVPDRRHLARWRRACTLGSAVDLDLLSFFPEPQAALLIEYTAEVVAAWSLELQEFLDL